MTTIKEELEKSYKRSCLESEIYLWQIYIIDHPEHKETYQKAIGENLDKLKLLEGYVMRPKSSWKNKSTTKKRVKKG